MYGQPGTYLTTEQTYDDAPDLTLAMPNERIAKVTQTASITDWEQRILLRISRNNATSNNTLLVVRLYIWQWLKTSRAFVLTYFQSNGMHM